MVTLFFSVLKLRVVVHEKFGFEMLKEVIDISAPVLYIEPTFAGIVLFGIPFEGDCGTDKNKTVYIVVVITDLSLDFVFKKTET